MNNAARRPSMPDAARWRAWLSFQSLFLALFFLVYFGADRLVAHRGDAVSPAFAFEAAIPFIPWTIVPYQSVFQIFVLPLFQLTAREIDALSRQSTATLLAAGAAFLALPTHLAYRQEEVAGLFAPLYAFLFSIDAVHNCAPSLHVAFAALILLACRDRAAPAMASIYALWLAALAIATLTTHRHHILDVATGLMLAVAIRHVIPLGATATHEPARAKSKNEPGEAGGGADPRNAPLDRGKHGIV